MKKKTFIINILIEYLLPITSAIILDNFIKIDFLDSFLKDSNKVSLLVTAYSILIGFIVTSMAIFISSNSKALINISKNNKAILLILYFLITLISCLFVIIFCIININLIIFKYCFILSFASIVLYISVSSNIFYITIKNLNKEQKEREEYEDTIKNELCKLKKILGDIYSKI